MKIIIYAYLRNTSSSHKIEYFTPNDIRFMCLSGTIHLAATDTITYEEHMDAFKELHGHYPNERIADEKANLKMEE